MINIKIRGQYFSGMDWLDRECLLKELKGQW